MTQSVRVTYARHVNPSFVKLLGVLGYGRVYTRAKDVWLWDDAGRQYLDALSAFGAVNVGHNHPRLAARLTRFLAEDAVNLCHVGPAPEAAALAAALAARLPEPLSVALFSTSGAEAVDAAMKVARAATGRPQFLYCHGGFHGTSLGTLSIMGEERMRRPFEKLLPGCEAVPFGDLAALEERLETRRFAAFVVEPIQCEAGIVIPPVGYLAEAQRLCRKYGTLMALDEVQTGIGRTGRFFAFQAAGFVPDILILGKSLGGGVASVSATMVSPEIQRQAYGTMDRFDLHGSTFSGNAFGCVAALETLAIVDEEKLDTRSAERGRRLLDGLRRGLDGHPLVRDVRGQGLLVGIELEAREWPSLLQGAGLTAAGIAGHWLAVELLERGIVCQPATQRWNVLRIEPPLTIGEAEVDRLVEAVCAVLDDRKSLVKTLGDVVMRVNRQFVSGWAF